MKCVFNNGNKLFFSTVVVMFLLRINIHSTACTFGQVFFDSGVLPTTVSRRPLGAELFWC